MAKVSVLVAVYNASAYLPVCLDSLLNQTLKDIQVVCIDDCSTVKVHQLKRYMLWIIRNGQEVQERWKSVCLYLLLLMVMELWIV